MNLSASRTGDALKVTVVGPGGVGGYFGARLAAAGHDVTFVGRGAHLEAMRARGLRLDSEIGPLHLRKVKVVSDARQVPAADVVIFAVKMRDTQLAAEGLRDLASKGATVFTFQNGVESADRIGAVLGADQVVAGTARIGASISAPGVIKQIGSFARLDFGERNGRPSTRTTTFYEACQRAGIDAHLSGNIQREVWLKFAMLAPVAGLTALTRGPIGLIRAHAETRALLQSAVDEVVAVGMSLKTGLAVEDADKIMKIVDGLPKAMMASMAHDLLAGKPIELGGLSGAVARLGKQAGVPVPTHTFIAQALAPFANGRPQV